MNRLVEIRSYQLQPGAGAPFHTLMSTRSLPLLRAWGMEVVTFGPSLHEPDHYFLMRAYDDLQHLQASQEAFYATPAWRDGPREEILALIETHANTVLWLSQEAVDQMRCSQGLSAP